MPSHKLTILSTCCQRHEHLYSSLIRWLRFNHPIIVVDYCCDPPLKIDHPQVRVFRVDNQKYFRKAHAVNIGIKGVETDMVLLLDADQYFLHDPIHQATIGPKEYRNVAGRIDDLPASGWGEFSHIGFGSGFCWTEDFYRVNGFQELCIGWGWEEMDFWYRLYLSGVQRQRYRTIECMWRAHTDNLRTAESPYKTAVLGHISNLMACQGYLYHEGTWVANYGEPMGNPESPIDERPVCSRWQGQSLADLLNKYASAEQLTSLRYANNHPKWGCHCIDNDYPQWVRDIIKKAETEEVEK